MGTMSTLLYGALTRKREDALEGTSTKDQPPGVNTYVDALAALVPAEVLALHAVVISLATETKDGTTTITAGDQLVFWFWFLTLGAAALYVVGLRKIPSGWDWVRMMIPAFAFVGWSMLQPTTVFDGWAPKFDVDWRWTLGLALAAVLGAAAGILGLKADAQRPNPPSPPAG
jgi:hypothetical protein